MLVPDAVGDRLEPTELAGQLEWSLDRVTEWQEILAAESISPARLLEAITNTNWQFGARKDTARSELGDEGAAASGFHANGDYRDADLRFAIFFGRAGFPFADLLLDKLYD